MYNALSQARTPGFRRWTLTPEVFEAHLGYLSQQGYQAITIAELTERRRRGTLDGTDRLVALTFDDAYADFRDVALPMLLRYGMTATLFVPTGYVGGRSEWMREAGERDRAVLTWDQLAQIARRGIEIGSHGHTHPELDTLPPRELAEQARLSKTLLEERLGAPARSIAYPLGQYDRRVRAAVGAAGYRAACTMNNWVATAGDHPLELPRLPMFADTDVPALAARLSAGRGQARRLVLRIRRAGQAGARQARLRFARKSAAQPGRAPSGTSR